MRSLYQQSLLFGGKICTKCQEWNPAENYQPTRYNRDGRGSWCRKCASVLNREWSRRNRDKAYRSGMATSLRVNYGLTIEQYEAMHAAQNGLCAICGKPETKIHRGRKMRLSVDHDHATGKVRALLCGSCNKGIGQFAESTEVLLRAAEYLQRHR